MGHLSAKDAYRGLGKKIDSLTAHAPWNEKLYAILKELYTSDEAELVAMMPYGLAPIDKIEQYTKIDRPNLERLLGGLAEKGLVFDMWDGRQYRYAVSPLIIGIFEFTMMRTRGELNYREWARLFHDYLQDKDTYYSANFGHGAKISPLRALPYEETIAESEYVEILDYEKASVIIDRTERFSIGICSCRHEKLHVGEKKCDIPLETCSSMGGAVEYMVGHGFAREVSKSEMLDNLARSKEAGLVLCADNVQKDVSFICHCCSCCCNVLLGISKFGYPHMLVTSSYIARTDKDTCIECGTCAASCPINAITMPAEGPPEIDDDICVGCGVCAHSCDTHAMRLTKRGQRVIHPETAFERIILQSLEQGTLQNLVFDNPQSMSHKFMRAFVGGFLRIPPVKKALMGDRLRSRFLEKLQQGA
ncbi:MAG: 4Fe-4S ferredoxin [candidate division Zixibacteria bacterium HGW-Zixibacteria-1]|nr:MAG: 4Fe-4S ferredoxin [candidate division Zixibacteria bacterium HGW-Zixibacteria-1]